MNVSISHTFSPVEQEFLNRALNSVAVQMYRSGLAIDIQLTDAMDFFDSDERFNGKEFVRHMEDLRGIIDKIKEKVTSNGKEVVLVSGRSISLKDIKLLSRTDKFLRDRFRPAMLVMSKER